MYCLTLVRKKKYAVNELILNLFMYSLNHRNIIIAIYNFIYIFFFIFSYSIGVHWKVFLFFCHQSRFYLFIYFLIGERGRRESLSYEQLTVRDAGHVWGSALVSEGNSRCLEVGILPTQGSCRSTHLPLPLSGLTFTFPWH